MNTIKTPEQIAQSVLYGDNEFPVYSDAGRYQSALTYMIAAIEADRVQREGQPVYVVLSEEGDVLDVTTNREWAEHMTRDDEDLPIRTIHEDTLWEGPENREDWNL